MIQDPGAKGLANSKNTNNIPQVSSIVASSPLSHFKIYCRITHRLFLYSYNTLIFIKDCANDKYYFTRDYNRSPTTSKHRNQALGFKLDEKMLAEMINRGQAEMI